MRSAHFILSLILSLLAWATSAHAHMGIKQAYFIPESFVEPRAPEELLKLIDSQGYRLTLPDSKAVYSPMMTPSHWDDTQRSPKPQNFGTYLIELDPGDPGEKGLSFNINEAYRLYVWTEGEFKLLREEGELSSDPKRNIYRLVPFSTEEVYFKYQSGSLWVLIQASAPLFEHGGQSFSSLGVVKFEYHTKDRIERNKYSTLLYQIICFGAFIFLFFYQFSIFLLRPDDKASLLIAITALVFLLRSVAEEQVIAVFFAQSDALATFNTSIQFLRFIFLNLVSFMVSFFLIRPVFTRGYVITLSVMNVITFGTICLLHLNPSIPGHIKDKGLSILTLVLLSSSLLSVWLFGKAVRARIPGAMFGLLGYLIGPTLVALDAMIILGKIDLFRVGTLGLVALTFSFALINGRQFAEAYRRAGKLNEELTEKNQEIAHINQNLEGIVEDRTRELRTIFHNIPQGVASLDDDGHISEHYSRHLELIVDRGPLGKRSIMEFFEQTSLSRDILDRMMQSLRAIVGEHEFAFTINAANLPLEASIDKQEGTRHYAITWGPEITEDGVIHAVLVTIEDVTEKKVLEANNARQQKEFVILQELVQCEAEKFSLFSRSSELLLAENMRLLRSDAISEDDCKILFVNAHTVKGGARTLGLNTLSSILHEVESDYGQMMKHNAQVPIASLRASLERAWLAFNQYITFNRDKLGRHTNESQVVLNMAFIREHYQNLESIVEESGEAPLNLLAKIRVTKDKLAEYIYKSDVHILEECLAPAEKVAKDLGKPAPRVDLKTENIPLSREVEGVLRNAMLHIVRNAIDHGIESVQERRIKGKPDAGTIAVRSYKQGSVLLIDIQDDGRGLAIRKLREKGVRAGLISENAQTKEVAQMIFQAGMSTAASVSQISGRGIGMDAVRKFIEEVGGKVEVQLEGQDGEYVQFRLHLELPLQAA